MDPTIARRVAVLMDVCQHDLLDSLPDANITQVIVPLLDATSIELRQNGTFESLREKTHMIHSARRSIRKSNVSRVKLDGFEGEEINKLGGEAAKISLSSNHNYQRKEAFIKNYIDMLHIFLNQIEQDQVAECRLLASEIKQLREDIVAISTTEDNQVQTTASDLLCLKQKREDNLKDLVLLQRRQDREQTMKKEKERILKLEVRRELEKEAAIERRYLAASIIQLSFRLYRRRKPSREVSSIRRSKKKSS